MPFDSAFLRTRCGYSARLLIRYRFTGTRVNCFRTPCATRSCGAGPFPDWLLRTRGTRSGGGGLTLPLSSERLVVGATPERLPASQMFVRLSLVVWWARVRIEPPASAVHRWCSTNELRALSQAEKRETLTMGYGGK